MLEVGTRVGPYEVISSLGAGGMGEVYRAHDTKLGRDIALKVLPETVANDADRIARFEREARALRPQPFPHRDALRHGGIRRPTPPHHGARRGRDAGRPAPAQRPAARRCAAISDPDR